MSRQRFPRGRISGLVGALLLVGAPAFLLRATCAGSSCEESASGRADVPFCSLPDSLRTSIAAGFRAGRSPDLFVVDGSRPTFDESARVPLIFSGVGVVAGARVQVGTTLDRVAPTIASILDFKRSHPEVRSGTAIDAVASGDVPRLVLEVVWKRGDSDQLRAAPDGWSFIRGLLDDGAGSLDVSPGALPLDPVATMTTVGTGAVPSQHGISGRIIRSESGRVVRAWGPGAPTSVVASLPDDLDEAMGQKPRIGLLRTARSDRGLIGGNWYIDVDRDDIIDSDEARVLNAGYGDDDVPDFLAAVVTGSPERVDRKVSALAGAAAEAANGSVLLVFTATGGDGSEESIEGLVQDVPEARESVEAVVSGGLFLNQDRLAEGDEGEDEIIDALKDALITERKPGTVDVFSDTAITFSRYC